MMFFMGRTVKPENLLPANQSMIAQLDGPIVIDDMPSASVVLYCDHADAGKLKVSYVNAPDRRVMFWVDFTGPIQNAI